MYGIDGAWAPCGLNTYLLCGSNLASPHSGTKASSSARQACFSAQSLYGRNAQRSLFGSFLFETRVLQARTTLTFTSNYMPGMTLRLSYRRGAGSTCNSTAVRVLFFISTRLCVLGTKQGRARIVGVWLREGYCIWAPLSRIGGTVSCFVPNLRATYTT